MRLYRTLLAIIITLNLLQISGQEWGKIGNCLKYPSCKIVTASDSCNEINGNDPCPGGRQSCFPTTNSSNPNPLPGSSCCCIQYDPAYKHLRSDARKPPRDNSKLRLYFMQYCPYCHRVALISASKNIPVDIVYVSLRPIPNWLSELGGRVPVLESDEGSIRDSLIIAEYLDETYRESGELYPTSTFYKAKDRVFINDFTKIIPTLFSEIIAGKGFNNPLEIPRLLKQLQAGLEAVEKELILRGTKFFSGNENPGMVDFMIWPWFERLPVIQIFYPGAVQYDRLQTLSLWIKDMKNVEAVRMYGIAPQIHYEYLESIRATNNSYPNYDLLAQPAKMITITPEEGGQDSASIDNDNNNGYQWSGTGALIVFLAIISIFQ